MPASTTQDNYYASLKGIPLAAKLVEDGQLEGPLYALAVYCLRSCHRPISRISSVRLEALYLKRHPWLSPAPDPHFMRVRPKSFRAWLLRNIRHIEMTEGDLRDEKSQHLRRLMDDYARNGPHFNDPSHRQAWEDAQAH